jgi:hypothetical protein
MSAKGSIVANAQGSSPRTLPTTSRNVWMKVRRSSSTRSSRSASVSLRESIIAGSTTSTSNDRIRAATESQKTAALTKQDEISSFFRLTFVSARTNGRVVGRQIS